MPYCDRCGTKLEENAHFCQRCGASVTVFVPPVPPTPAPAKSLRNDSAVIIAVVLVAVLVVAVIVIAVFLALYPISFNQTNSGNGVNQINFAWTNLQLSRVAQNFSDKIHLLPL
jgi:uncharacterized membrane protein YvbJ